MTETPLQASQRVRAALVAERLALLDHSVSFLIEDSWRSVVSTDPLHPAYRSRSPYPIGKQAAAHACDSSRVAFVEALANLEALQGATLRKVTREVESADRLAGRRLRAAQEPLAVIEPQSSLPGVQGTIRELEKRCLLPIEEIRGCFRQGRRSAVQKATRTLVEDAIRAMLEHYRMVHPVAADPERYGTLQLRQARAVWREFAGTKNWGEREMAVRLWAFGDSNEDIADPEGRDPAIGHHVARGNGATKQTPHRPRRPQILPRLAEALAVSPRTVERMVAKTSPNDTTYMEELLTGWEVGEHE